MENETVSGKGTFGESYNINKYDVVLRNELFECRIFWARIISSESETLFTNYTRHTFFEMQYALEGQIGMRLDGERHIYINESDFIVIPPDTWHQITDGDSEGARFIIAFSFTEAAAALGDRLRNLNSLNVFHETPGMRPLLSLLIGKNYHDAPVRKGIISSLLECFLLEMLEAVSPARNRMQNPYFAVPGSENAHDGDVDSRIRAIAEYIHEYNGIGLSVSGLARRFGMSERQFCRVVTAAAGKSPKELINHEKLCKIEELITSTDLSFGEISVLCGFSDEYAMNKFFRRYNKVTLSSFRRIYTKK